MAAASSSTVTQGKVLAVGEGAEADVSQAKVLAVAEGAEADVSQGRVMVVANFPSDNGSVSQAGIIVVGDGAGEAQVSQVKLLVVGRGKIEDPKLKTWGYTLDGHDNVVLRLGNTGKTLVFDISTKTWSWWASPDSDRWRPNSGFNWRSSGTISSDYGSPVVVGDDSAGLLWVLDPEKGMDDALSGNEELAFERVAVGQATVRGRNFQPVYSIYLTASGGNPKLSGNTVTLDYSDDLGHTYVTADAPQASVSGNYNQEFAWRSMGRVAAPGRIFRLTDNGAFARIDSMDMNE